MTREAKDKSRPDPKRVDGKQDGARRGSGFEPEFRPGQYKGNGAEAREGFAFEKPAKDSVGHDGVEGWTGKAEMPTFDDQPWHKPERDRGRD